MMVFCPPMALALVLVVLVVALALDSVQDIYPFVDRTTHTQDISCMLGYPSNNLWYTYHILLPCTQLHMYRLLLCCWWWCFLGLGIHMFHGRCNRRRSDIHLNHTFDNPRSSSRTRICRYLVGTLLYHCRCSDSCHWGYHPGTANIPCRNTPSHKCCMLVLSCLPGNSEMLGRFGKGSFFHGTSKDLLQLQHQHQRWVVAVGNNFHHSSPAFQLR